MIWLLKPKSNEMFDKQKDMNYCEDGINQLSGYECGIQSTRGGATLVEDEVIVTDLQDDRGGATIVGRYHIL